MSDQGEGGISRRVLVLEDNEAVHEEFRAVSCAGKSVVEFTFARNENEALEFLQHQTLGGQIFEAVILGVRRLSELRSLRIAERLQHADPGLPIAFCTQVSDGVWNTLARMLHAPRRLPVLKRPFAREDLHRLLQLLREERLQEGASKPVPPAEEKGSPQSIEGLSPAGSALPKGFEQAKGRTLLVVDDEPELLKVLKVFLEKAGYEVLTAANGIEGLRRYESARERIKAIITDSSMPEMDGLSFVTALRMVDPDISIISTTGMNSASHQLAVSKLGVRHVLSKPFTLHSLLTILSDAISPAESAGGLTATPVPGHD